MGVNNPIDLGIKGEPNPKIPHPSENDWNGLSLPWMSYGYGILLTPLQILSFYNGVANNGEMVKPTFLESTSKLGSTNFYEFKKEIINPSICSKKTLSIVQKMLLDVIHHKNGTAKNIKSEHIKIAGKTGTAQVKRISKRERELDLELEQIPYKDRDHALYVAYGPYINPRYALSIIVEHGGSGSKAAAPIAKKLFKLIIDRHDLRNKQSNFERITI